MIRSHLEDAAVAAAKAYSHGEVEPRHILYAIARYFRKRPEVSALFERTKNALDPSGASFDVPTLTNEARALLDSVVSEQHALEVFLNAMQEDVDGPPPIDSPTQTASPTEAETEPELAPEPPTEKQAESVSEVLQELDALVGLVSVKTQLRNVIAVVQANEERTKAGMPAVNPGLHLVFLGPPGTGKTTVARLVARLYSAIGALPGSKFMEASRADLVAGFVGQTALKTTELIAKTIPGVLFIDEAYSLTPRHDSDFGAEAIATLVKAMEDHRGELAVIAAGYGQEMSEFIESNPGLRSRFKTYIDFPDYGPKELGAIFQEFAKNSEISLENGVVEKAQQIFEKTIGTDNFGNARFARSLFEHAYARMAARVAEDGVITVDELTALSVEDVEWHDTSLDQEPGRIGFAE